jgi:hypothetical protein
MTEPTAIRPVIDHFPGRTPRWVNDQCRAGRIRGAIKIGRTWMITTAAVDRLFGGGTAANDDVRAAPEPVVPTMDEALADLRARGIL